MIDDCGVCGGNNADKDCNGDCFGDAVVDDCGQCDGDSSSCTAFLEFGTYCDMNVEILYSSYVNIAGFQFTISNINIESTFGGAGEEYGFNVSNSENTVIGFSLEGNTIPAGQGVLTNIELDGVNPTPECFEEIIISDSNGNEIPSLAGACADLWSDLWSDDGIVDGACDCDGNVLDECGVCGGTGQDSDSDGICDDIDDCIGDYDCAGDCNGDAVIDDCGVCNGDNADLDDCGVCFGNNEDQDCAGECFGDAIVDDCGVCNGNNQDQDCSGDCFGDAIIDECGICEGDSSSCFDSYFDIDIGSTGKNHLVVIENILGLEAGDEIGLFDTNGLINSEDCSDEYGELLVGAGIYNGSQMEIVGIGSLDFCDLPDGYQLSGWVEDNPITIKIWDASQNYEYEATQFVFESGGQWNELFSTIVELDANIYGCTDPEAGNYNEYATVEDNTCVYIVTQQLEVNGVILNNISLSMHSCFIVL